MSVSAERIARWLWTVLRATIEAVRRFDAKGGWVLSSHVAMSMMLALFPFVLFVVALAGFVSREFALAGFLSDQAAIDDVVELVFGAWPDAIEAPIVTEVTAVIEANNSRLMTVGGVLVLYFASNGVDAVREAMTRAYHDTETRPYWRARLLCVVFVLVGAVALLGAVAFALAVPIYSRLVSAATPWPFLQWVFDEGIGQVIILSMPVLAVLAAHVWLPGRRHRLRRILPGVVLTVVLWMIVGWGFSFYVRSFGSYAATYAGLAGAMAALIFLYLISAILILGAEFNGALMDLAKDD
ncbi:MAG: YihY/virulence factor BrkB family protein [Rhodobacteraceae bacterium]|nr:YihY/virulence factor BrkB family protein [Paracoccaceae bacterium]